MFSDDDCCEVNIDEPFAMPKLVGSEDEEGGRSDPGVHIAVAC